MGRRANPGKALPTTAGDEHLQSLLLSCGCPIPLHKVRTRFLGSIASPISPSPLETVKGLWGGRLPAVEGIDALNELLSALVMGLWNRLARHQERNAPFRLLRSDLRPTREGLVRMAQMRREELEGFVEGIYGEHKIIDLPQSAGESLNTLAEIRAMLEGVCQIVADESKPASSTDLGGLIRNLHELTKIAEREMHAVVLDRKSTRLNSSH